MRQVILLHGTGGSPSNHWFPWLQQELAQAGYQVIAPALPEPDQADLATWVPYILMNYSLTPETVLIGHSAGCALILELLNQINTPVKRAILVAGFIQPLAGMAHTHPTLPKGLDAQRLKQNCADLYMLNSDNDPWGCDHVQGEAMRAFVGGRLIICSGEGHFGSQKFGQSYLTFPLVKALAML